MGVVEGFGFRGLYRVLGLWGLYRVLGFGFLGLYKELNRGLLQGFVKGDTRS